MAKPKASPIMHQISEEDRQLYMSFCTKIVAGGFVTAEALQQEYGGEAFTKCIATLFRTHRLLREVRRTFENQRDTLGYEWADKRHSQAEMKKLPPELGIIVETFSKKQQKYTDYVAVRARCRWTNKVFGAMPFTEKSGDDLRRFDRNGSADSVVIPAYCLRAMFAKGLPLIHKEAALADRIRVAAVRIENPMIEVEIRPILDKDGRTGLGLQRSEYMPPGTEFDIDAQIPTSILRPDEFASLLNVCGKYVRFSPARSSGFGDFELIEMSEG